MAIPKESQPEALITPMQSEPLLAVLTHWQKPQTDLTPLSSLRLYRQTERDDAQAALVRVLQLEEAYKGRNGGNK